MPSFNVLIEGSSFCPLDLTFKTANVQIPQGVDVVYDGVHHYSLLGRTGDFEDFSRDRRFVVVGREANIESLENCQGIVLPYGPDFARTLSGPRTILLRDGRLFTNRSRSFGYLRLIPEVLKEARRLFTDCLFDELYSRVVM